MAWSAPVRRKKTLDGGEGFDYIGDVSFRV